MLDGAAQCVEAATRPLFWGNRAGVVFLEESGYDVLYAGDDLTAYRIINKSNEKTLVQYANRVAKALGLKTPCIGFSTEGLHDGDAVGVFISGSESTCPTIIVDVQSHPSSAEVIDTVLHELAHAYQWTVLPQDDWYMDDAESIAEEFCRQVNDDGLQEAVKELKDACENAVLVARESP